MKSQRRHDLETNELAKRLTTWGDRVRPYSTAITVTVVAIAAVVLVVLFFSGRRQAAQRAAWDQYTYAITSTSTDWDALRDAAEDHSGTAMSELANVTWADNELRQATSLYFRDQAAAENHLDNARSVYRDLINESQDPAIVNRARLGMARVLETQGKPQEAAEFYQTVEGAFAEFAQQRAKELMTESAQDSITWLATAEMPEISAPTGPGTPGARPPFSDFQLDPSIPTQLPTGIPSGTAGGGLPDASAPAGGQGGGTAPLTGDEPLDFDNPFGDASDPDRYATPPAGDATEDAAPAESDASAPPATEGTPAEQPVVVEEQPATDLPPQDAAPETAADSAAEGDDAPVADEDSEN